MCEAVRQAKSTRDHFQRCWNRYKQRLKDKGEDYYLEDVFRMFRDAGFGSTKSADNSDGKLKFVRQILEGNVKSTQVCMYIRTLFSGMNSCASSCVITVMADILMNTPNHLFVITTIIMIANTISIFLSSSYHHQ